MIKNILEIQNFNTMIKIHIFILTTLFINTLSFSQNKRKVINNNKTQINQTLDTWHKYAAASDFKNYFSLMDKKSVFIGTDSSEVWTKKEFMKYAKPVFKKKKGWKFTPTSRHIYLSKNGKIAWFDELLDTWMGKCRGSGVLVFKNGKWLIKQYVLSLTIPNEKMKGVIKLLNF